MKNTEVYSRTLVLKSSDVNMHRELRTSKLFELLQEISIAHTEELGFGRAKTLDKGILWMVTLQQAEITRIPCYDEKITLETWPGSTIHVLFPRYYRVLDEKGNVLISASAIWMLVDAKSRKCVFPEQAGIDIKGVTTGNEIHMPVAISHMDTDRVFEFSVPFSYIDLNGHMNNTRYFDLADDHIILPGNDIKLRSISTEYLAEIRKDEKIQVEYGNTDAKYYFSGTGAKNYFKMIFTYE